MADVSMRQIRKSYGDVEVLHGIDLEIRSGEFIVFVGPSGCGKSTLLRLIAGLETITAGDLVIDGKRMNAVAPSQRGISMVFQSYALYPHMTVYENIAFGLRIAAMPKAEIDARVCKVVKILQLEPYQHRRPRALSGGQRQRVAIGRAIVRNPRVFLFDEPLSNLDAALRVATRIEIAKLKQNMPGVTMVYVTHDQVEAMTLADRICVFKDGCIEQVGTPTDLYRQPANLFVAQFIGSPAMNILKGKIVERAAGSARCLLDCGVLLEVAAESGKFLKDAAVSVGVRPENARLAREHETDSTFVGVIDLVEHLGEIQLLHLDLSGCNEKFLIKADGESFFARGQRVRLTARRQDMHVFDAAGNAVPCRGR